MITEPRISSVPPRSFLPAAVAIIVAIIALAIRSHSSTQPSHAQTPAKVRAGNVTIAIANYAFAPKTIDVRVGTRVSWTNHDATAHTATADHDGFDTGTVGPHATQTVKFAHPGTYTYHCAFHAFMTATIMVRR